MFETDTKKKSNNMLQYIIFTLAEQEFGINVMDSKEIVTVNKLTKIPESPDYVRGVIELREEIIPIIDLNYKFNLKNKLDVEGTKIIIVTVNNVLVGLLVNEVEEIIRINPESIFNPPEITKNIDKRYIQGLARVEGRLLVLIDIKSLLSLKEIEDIQNIEK